MIKLSNSYILRIVTRLLILLALAKAISLAIWGFLPSDGVELQVKDNYKPQYQRVDFKNMLGFSQDTRIKTQADGIKITSMVLKGLYGKGSKGFAIVALKSSAKNTSIVSVGEVFSGYSLKSILNHGVTFTKANEDYVLRMEHSGITRGSITVVTGGIGEPKDVPRTDIDFYARNPKQIWKDISIQEVKSGNSIKGFKVTRIKKNSKMAKLGLKKGDVIMKVNNVELKSYKDALDVYAKVNKLKTVQIVVMRNNQEQELVYEIY